MRTLEILAALIVGVVLFVVLKLIGLLLKFALIAAILGFLAGLGIARALRKKSS